MVMADASHKATSSGKLDRTMASPTASSNSATWCRLGFVAFVALCLTLSSVYQDDSLLITLRPASHKPPVNAPLSKIPHLNNDLGVPASEPDQESFNATYSHDQDNEIESAVVDDDRDGEFENYTGDVDDIYGEEGEASLQDSDGEQAEEVDSEEEDSEDAGGQVEVAAPAEEHTGSSSKVEPSVGVGVESQPATATPPVQIRVDPKDYIYNPENWDGPPIVMEKHKLLFFTVPKVACTTFKQLFRRMMGYADWRMEEYVSMIPWNPETNGLKYLNHYDIDQATAMMTDPSWTRAIFVREPKSRLLAAYLDKAFHPTYLGEKCCSDWSCVEPAKESLEGFFALVQKCPNSHWMPQARRMEPKYWPFINFVGHLESIQEDSKLLLDKLGVWEAFGASGWGDDNAALFAPVFDGNGRLHATNASSKLGKYFTTHALVASVEEFYREDYENPIMNMTKIPL